MPIRSAQSTASLTAKDVAILTSLAALWYLTPAQMERLHWRGKAITTVQARLKRLAEAGYADRFPDHAGTLRGRPAFVYRLGPRGLSLLRDLGEPTPPRLNLFRAPGMQLAHTLAANDVTIAAKLLGERGRGVILSGIVHEKELHLSPPRVRLPDGSVKGFELDGALFFDVAGEGRVVMLEVDMGNTRAYWTRKLALLRRYADDLYADEYGVPADSFALVVYSPKGAVHLAHLVAWTEEFLDGEGLRAWGDRFTFTDLPAHATDPSTFFLEPTGRRPFRDGPVPLLGLPS